GKQITYGDLVHEYIGLNQHEGSFKQARSGRYINFLANFMADNPSASREEAISTWKELKNLDIPKTYADWKKYSQK
ncbi:MAG: hypothetical protein KDD94_13755, partial [Calditrichaeota bacterium]|nr:hypothetical protein [Calditrichota bacterium]